MSENEDGELWFLNLSRFLYLCQSSSEKLILFQEVNLRTKRQDLTAYQFCLILPSVVENRMHFHCVLLDIQEREDMTKNID